MKAAASARIRVCSFTAPVPRETAREIEALFSEIFEYGDYSFRSALLGEYAETLNCTFFCGRENSRIVGAATCLYACRYPTVSLIGPVGVRLEYRRQGIGAKLLNCAVDFLRGRGVQAIYLGVPRGSGAVNFYRKAGFAEYHGVVMRRLLSSQSEFEACCFGRCARAKIRRAVWGDFPGVSALASFPCSMYTFDFRRSIFSSRYVEPGRFLSLFPQMMKAFVKYGGFANILSAGEKENIVGIAGVTTLPGTAQRHVAEMDFYVHDNFLAEAERLIRKTLEEASRLFVEKVNVYCPACDKIKRKIIAAFPAVRVGILPGNIRINNRYEDVLIYQFGTF